MFFQRNYKTKYKAQSMIKCSVTWSITHIYTWVVTVLFGGAQLAYREDRLSTEQDRDQTTKIMGRWRLFHYEFEKKVKVNKKDKMSWIMLKNISFWESSPNVLILTRATRQLHQIICWRRFVDVLTSNSHHFAFIHKMAFQRYSRRFVLFFSWHYKLFSQSAWWKNVFLMPGPNLPPPP